MEGGMIRAPHALMHWEMTRIPPRGAEICARMRGPPRNDAVALGGPREGICTSGQTSTIDDVRASGRSDLAPTASSGRRTSDRTRAPSGVARGLVCVCAEGCAGVRIEGHAGMRVEGCGRRA